MNMIEAKQDLHSNMFLLRLKTGIDILVALASFTFQYVSIKTVIGTRKIQNKPKFTFQYVSIKTPYLFGVYDAVC